ncbi:polar amino acid transport system permease protein [Vibrio xiamenensis]|uniref:Polar amino acid transport system permease protein n=1 Tax=Vibrio xiamenensis TaxID=861298 RepID=A0A1G7W8J5_9VIBR|nr:amino acid ABC transporter permease [Vibrio xiamenensis]SDG68149.1 polar amino acid transport system permease protein [Vibrio xiamenensis]
MDWSSVISSLPTLTDGFIYTLQLCLLSATLTLLFGAFIAFVLLRNPLRLRRVAQIYSDITLTLPLLIVLYVLYFVLPEYNVVWSSPTVGVVALTLYYAPYVAQVIRAAIMNLPRGQWEACHSLGMSRRQTLGKVVLPQCLPQMISPLVGLLIGLIKDSALLSVISVQEFMYAAKQAISDTYAPLEIYLTVAVIYWILNSLIDWLARRTESRMTRYLNAGA